MGWERELMKWGAGWWTAPVLDEVIPWLTHLGSTVALILFILMSWILTSQKKVLWSLLLLGAIQSAVVYGLKFLVQRPRPFAVDVALSRLSGGRIEIFDPSFPSAHTVNAFMMATVLSTWFPRYRVIFFLMAAFIGWTRIYLGMHYPTDVLAGGLIGYGITRLYLHWAPLSSGRLQTKEKRIPSSGKESGR
jgi:undecaprenyl-diphosphatase